MSTIFLIRHGLTDQTGTYLYGRTPGVSLDHRGLGQAQELARRFSPVKLTAIYSSPLERCTQTVEPLAKAQRLPVVTDEDLIEMHAGSWTGKRLSRLRTTKAWHEVQTSPSTFRFPDGGESFAEAQARIVRAISRIAKRHRRGRVAVATHGDIVRILMAHSYGAPLDAFQRIVIDTGSVSVIAAASEVLRVLLMNDTGGLERFGRAPSAPWESSKTPARTKLGG
jgi:probable phosphomutase (TIGR03848 family)